MEFLGIRFVGFNPENGQKLLLTFIFIFAIIFLKYLVKIVIRRTYDLDSDRKIFFWSKQGLNLVSAVVIFLTILSIWFDDPTRLATGLGLVSAGLAFALQKVVTSFAGYLVIMRGNTFSVGERITMGGIRGDVVALGFLQTTIMEMGQPPSVQGADPAMWVRGRQFTGRIVTVTNDKIFENPVYNYTRDFPFIWEEMVIPIKYQSDRHLAEKIILEVVARQTTVINEASRDLKENLYKKYGVKSDDMIPRVFYRITDNWLELTVRFIVNEHGVRDVKDAIAREILDAFLQKNIEIASATFEVVGLPRIQLETDKLSALSRRGPEDWELRSE